MVASPKRKEQTTSVEKMMKERRFMKSQFKKMKERYASKEAQSKRRNRKLKAALAHNAELTRALAEARDTIARLSSPAVENNPNPNVMVNANANANANVQNITPTTPSKASKASNESSASKEAELEATVAELREKLAATTEAKKKLLDFNRRLRSQISNS